MEKNKLEAFRDAVEANDLSGVMAHLQSGADVDAREDGTASTMLCLAASHGHLEMAALLLDNNADIEKTGSGDATPLKDAAYMGNIKMVELLLARGAEINAVDAEGRTCLMDAVEVLNFELAKLLINKGIDITILDDRDETAMDKAHEKLAWFEKRPHNSKAYDYKIMIQLLEEAPEVQARLHNEAQAAAKAAEALARTIKNSHAVANRNQLLQTAHAPTYTIKRRVQP